MESLCVRYDTTQLAGEVTVAVGEVWEDRPAASAARENAATGSTLDVPRYAMRTRFPLEIPERLMRKVLPASEGPATFRQTRVVAPDITSVSSRCQPVTPVGSAMAAVVFVPKSRSNPSPGATAEARRRA